MLYILTLNISMVSHVPMAVQINQRESILSLCEQTLSSTIFRRGCCGKTQLCEVDEWECTGPLCQKQSLCRSGYDINYYMYV